MFVSKVNFVEKSLICIQKYLMKLISWVVGRDDLIYQMSTALQVHALNFISVHVCWTKDCSILYWLLVFFF